jgi:hypothetical protein
VDFAHRMIGVRGGWHRFCPCRVSRARVATGCAWPSTEAGDHYEYGDFARVVTIPATLRDSLMAWLDRFMPVKEIAQIGAAIGREFSYELIAAVASMPQAQLDDALARLSQSGLVFRRGTPPDALYTFKHALVQDAAYDSLLRSRRQELHAKIAQVIETRFRVPPATLLILALGSRTRPI